MSLQAMAWAVEYQDLPLDKRTGCVSSSCKLVILALANHADRDGRDCFPSVETIRCFTGLSERMIQYALRALEDHGVIRRTVDPLVRASTIRDGRCRPTSYDIVPPIRGAKSEVRGASRGAKSKIDSLDQGCMVDDEFAPEPTPKPTPTSKSEPTSKSSSRDKSLEIYTRARDEDRLGVEARGRPDDDAEVLVVHEQDLFGGDQLPVSNGKIKKPAQRDAEFDAFWRIYPKRVGKIDARRAWDRALTRVELGRLMAGAETYVRYVQADPWRRQFTKDPATWLNKGCWDDELDFGPPSRNGHQKTIPPRVSATDRAVDEVRTAFRELRESGGQLGLPGGPR